MDTGNLVEQFGSMQTVDHADLVRQMRRLVGGEEAVSEAYAKFYLEMSNWNVHAAVGHYFDLNGSSGANASGQVAVQINERLPSMTFVRDVTIGEGESVPPSTHFTKTWAVSNSGPEAWPPGCVLKYTQGERLQATSDRIEVGRCLRPGETMDISLKMRSPDRPGIYEAQWRMSSPSGAFFGDTIWVILTVEPSGTLALTQQMDQFHDLGTSSSSSATAGTSAAGSSAIYPANGLLPMRSSPTAAAAASSSAAVINPFASPPRRQQLSHQLIGGGGAAAAARPSSPTDHVGQDQVVSARNILERSLTNPDGDEDMN